MQFLSVFFSEKILHLKHSSVWCIWFYQRDHSAKVFNRTFQFENLRARWPRLWYVQIVFITFFESVNIAFWLVLIFLKFHFSFRIVKMFKNERRRWRLSFNWGRTGRRYQFIWTVSTIGIATLFSKETSLSKVVTVKTVPFLIQSTVLFAFLLITDQEY